MDSFCCVLKSQIINSIGRAIQVARVNRHKSRIQDHLVTGQASILAPALSIS